MGAGGLFGLLGIAGFYGLVDLLVLGVELVLIGGFLHGGGDGF